ncbi:MULTISPECIES: O30 family O-antigen polymerase [Enterobacteriaceae]|jgi:hypothetical protein|uniref:O-antigen polymerase n=2 Tax=Escherichia coli TaxID=562 RepID=A0A0B4N3P3_ECOLX|nr:MULTISPECIES: O30 family O-antigen polymerase [Enterobacteriaceae]MDY4505201.1 O30 family O-antigen polymerase [[Actinobacillus] rossii]AIG62591.1 O-antigen polymerase [Escherichia coli]EFK8253792.1 O30 family O-antigen polymerase [Escherichia coli]EFK8391194.1 O30 family O-antigen polymerase [Escherichia coli]EGK2916506.1 O30 family O-antigen polymerase [Escherichia coli]
MFRISDFFKVNLLFLILTFSYVNLISKQFSYMGFKDDFNIERFGVSLIFCVLVAIYYASVQEFFNKFISTLFLIFVIMPNLVLFSGMGGDIRIIIWCVLSLPITLFLLRILPVIKLPVIKDKQVGALLWGLLILCIIPVLLAHGINFNLKVFLLDVYDIRRESRLANTMASVYAYFWLAKVICPIALVYAIERKKIIMAMIFTLVLLYLFMTTGHKSVFFTVILIMVMYKGGMDYQKKSNYIFNGALILFIFSILLTAIFSINILESLFIRRLLFIPALLNTYYFDFFDNKFVYYSSSYLSSIIDYPYDRPIPEVIGLNYFNSDEMSANNGYISDGFANAGSIGIFINIVLASILLKIFKDYDVNPKYAGLIFVSFYAIQGSAMSTVLMTHGGILLLILVPMVLGRRK